MKGLTPIVMPPLSALYGAITRARLALYERGTFSVFELDAKVISVGNITTGGTGKTPLVEWLARRLHLEGRKVCILTRGYGRANSVQRVVVSDGSKVRATPDVAGDEAFLLARNLEGITAIVCDSDRVGAGRWALSELGVDTFVLDDGFQHLRLHRDVNVLTLDATNPWGGGHLLPFGRLREPLSGLERADCIVLTRTDQIQSVDEIVDELASRCPGRPVFISRMVKRAISSLRQSPADTAAIPGSPVLAFCGVGNPGAFFEQLKSEGFELAATRVFPDHHFYNQQDVDSLIQEAKRSAARSLVTTAKDSVKLSPFDFDIPCYVLEIEICFNDEERFLELIRNSLANPRN